MASLLYSFLLLAFLPPSFTVHDYQFLPFLAIIEFTLFTPQPFLASCRHLSKTVH